MKTIKQDTVLTGFDGKPLQLGVGGMILKDVLLACLGRFVTQDGEKNVIARDMGCKLYNHSGSDFEVEDAQFEVIKEAVGQNSPQFTAVVMGLVHGLLDGKA